MPHTIEKPEAQWREELDPEQFRIARLKGNERPFAGEYWDVWDKGSYHCRCCDVELFGAEAKFDAGDGWATFHSEAQPGNIEQIDDFSRGNYRIEAACRHCGAHLGHIFDDGPGPNGTHYRINSASIRLNKKP
ncbi:peptide-methionine (R)-S-oxide reductase MsrB [Uliginosibacterium flavum]|uniref:peptide-methionine (R)-S-oxide reductase n=1 Tax=Uliginosibacterium flavum TaxID=1396831 RepID=A0ABV2TJF5_9RHOO